MKKIKFVEISISNSIQSETVNLYCRKWVFRAKKIDLMSLSYNRVCHSSTAENEYLGLKNRLNVVKLQSSLSFDSIFN